MKQLKEEKAELTSLKNQQYEEYSGIKARHKQIQVVNQNVHVALGIMPNLPESQKIQRKNTNQAKEQSI